MGCRELASGLAVLSQIDALQTPHKVIVCCAGVKYRLTHVAGHPDGHQHGVPEEVARDHHRHVHCARHPRPARHTPQHPGEFLSLINSHIPSRAIDLITFQVIADLTNAEGDKVAVFSADWNITVMERGAKKQ